MAHRATAIANEFLGLPGAAENITQMQLQKLAYIAHGWNLAINNAPLISEPVEAWDYGPVYRDLYDHTKFFGKQPIGRQITPDDDDMARFFLKGKERNTPPYRSQLSNAERAVIQHVWRRYGSLSAIQLSSLTHQQGTPWFETYTKKGKNSVIDEASIKRHYDELARRAQAVA